MSKLDITVPSPIQKAHDLAVAYVARQNVLPEEIAALYKEVYAIIFRSLKETEQTTE